MSIFQVIWGLFRRDLWTNHHTDWWQNNTVYTPTRTKLYLAQIEKIYMSDCQIKKGTIIIQITHKFSKFYELIPPSNPPSLYDNHSLPAFYIAKNPEFYGPGHKIPDSTIWFSIQADFPKKNRSEGVRGVWNTWMMDTAM